MSDVFPDGTGPENTIEELVVTPGVSQTDYRDNYAYYTPNDQDEAVFSGRRIGSIIANVTVEEEHADELAITDHPVETGAAITDHAYKVPAVLTLRVGWSNSSDDAAGADDYVRQKYAELLDLQASRETFSVETGKRSYPAMLMRSLAITTDEGSEYALYATVVCREIITVSTQVVAVPPQSQQASPQDTAGAQPKGQQQVTPAKAPNISALAQIAGVKP